jgi:hypothetical protein
MKSTRRPEAANSSPPNSATPRHRLALRLSRRSSVPLVVIEAHLIANLGEVAR